MTDVEWILVVIVAAGLFGLWELVGVDPRFKHFHTISWYAQRHRWLAIFIGVLFVLGGGFGLIWWVHHLSSHSIFK